MRTRFTGGATGVDAEAAEDTRPCSLWEPVDAAALAAALDTASLRVGLGAAGVERSGAGSRTADLGAGFFETRSRATDFFTTDAFPDGRFVADFFPAAVRTALAAGFLDPATFAATGVFFGKAEGVFLRKGSGFFVIERDGSTCRARGAQQMHDETALYASMTKKAQIFERI